MENILYLSFVTASVSFTFSETSLFAPPRKWIRGKSSFIGKLISCGYCLGHWIAFVLVAIYRPRLFSTWPPLDYILTALVIAWLGAFQWAVMCWLIKKTGK
ncbi:MAG: DUF1360 domain-containing protein [Desulfobacterales bacterium]|nr:DUF1360 domain-containing protein [Desulfobacterales bacterium]